MQALVAVAQQVQQSCEAASERGDKLRLKQKALRQRLIAVAAKVEAVVASSFTEHAGEARLHRALGGLQRYLSHESQLRERIDQLVLIQRMQADATAAGAALPSDAGRAAALFANAEDTRSLVRQLAAHSKGIEQVMSILRRDVSHLQIMGDALATAGAVTERSRTADSLDALGGGRARW